MKGKIFLVMALIAVILGGCGQAGTKDEVSKKENEVKDVQAVDNVKELVSDYSLRKIKDESASITSQQLLVKKNDGKEIVYDLSKEDFFVSIAPYVNQTHP